MTERKLLTGKVADILGDYELAINLGRNSDVKPGVDFAVLGAKQITDPDTGKKLGTYKYDKVKVRVIQVEDNYSVATTKITPSWIPALAGFEVAYPKLRPGSTAAWEELDRDVRVGDVVEERR